MRYEARLTAYDCLDQIMVAYTLQERPDNPEAPSVTVLRGSQLVPGEGQQEPARWLSDALVAALETL